MLLILYEFMIDAVCLSPMLSSKSCNKNKVSQWDGAKTSTDMTELRESSFLLQNYTKKQTKSSPDPPWFWIIFHGILQHNTASAYSLDGDMTFFFTKNSLKQWLCNTGTINIVGIYVKTRRGKGN